MREKKMAEKRGCCTYPFSKKLSVTCMTPEEYCKIPTSGDCSISVAASSKQSCGTRVSESINKI